MEPDNRPKVVIIVQKTKKKAGKETKKKVEKPSPIIGRKVKRVNAVASDIKKIAKERNMTFHILDMDNLNRRFK